MTLWKTIRVSFHLSLGAPFRYKLLKYTSVGAILPPKHLSEIILSVHSVHIKLLILQWLSFC